MCVCVWVFVCIIYIDWHIFIVNKVFILLYVNITYNIIFFIIICMVISEIILDDMHSNRSLIWLAYNEKFIIFENYKPI